MTLETIKQHAANGRWAEMLLLADEQENSCCKLEDWLDLGALLFSAGFLSRADACFDKARNMAPNDLRALVNQASLARDTGEHGKASRLYSHLLNKLPNSPVAQRNALITQEYDPEVADATRLAKAKAWGKWAIARAGGMRVPPAPERLQGRPLRLGYVSADFCQHTVGLFVKDVLDAHDQNRIKVFAYGAGQVKDWVTEEISAACTLRDVSALDDPSLADLIRSDQIDVLVDLSGHSAGSRLTAFAYRPAPVMVSWLGYFATTGLPCMDAVLLDEWHAPSDVEAQYVEPIIRLPGGRLCYKPVPWAPHEVTPLPLTRNGFITFGCFNNTAKLNDGVFDVWSTVLAVVPISRLVLKWRTFNDEALRQKVTLAFVSRGIAAERIEVRGPSFHADVLKEYADIDIALDPFPFTGGLTSCEALWMGVPVVTWPLGRVVSRQTYAILNQIGLPELAAKNGDDYVRIASELARDIVRLAHLRGSMRERMLASSLMNVAGFTAQLEDALIELFDSVGKPAEASVALVR